MGFSSAHNIWEKPGCFKVGHTRTISIPGCVEFDITTNACRGFCVSYSVPSSEDSMRVNQNKQLLLMANVAASWKLKMYVEQQ
ncbi:u11-Sparatoxin-Hju1a_1 [Caerostris extrusa]|uniref:U11-Sparatoxin-Hju1a_1 n=1 Tax=Caerostris extrusa TaxID=172846 RepID=A0AAV4XBP4_CAEEX|nr:u11-Sparatoxin-Hju1a_1 [Caerostris extrusa]